MHVLKVIILLVLTLAAMRLVSWSLLWLLRRFSRSDSLYLRPASNALALCGFAGLLVLDSVPGEILDLRALVFGIFIYVIYSGLDLRWVPRLLRR